MEKPFEVDFFGHILRSFGKRPQTVYIVQPPGTFTAAKALCQRHSSRLKYSKNMHAIKSKSKTIAMRLSAWSAWQASVTKSVVVLGALNSFYSDNLKATIETTQQDDE